MKSTLNLPILDVASFINKPQIFILLIINIVQLRNQYLFIFCMLLDYILFKKAVSLCYIKQIIYVNIV